MSTTAAGPVSPSSLLVGGKPTPVSPDAGDGGAVAARLLAYLGFPGLRFQEAPRSMEGGWEAYTYAFRFRARPGLPHALRGPLVLRVYSSPEGLPRGLHEYAAQEWLHRAGFPVPRPYLLEAGTGVFGGPFLVTERVAGRPVLEVLRRQPWRLWNLPGHMGQLHARLHALPAAGFPAARGQFLSRRLDELDGLIKAHGLHGLRPGLDWLALHRPAPAGGSQVLHLDWHPLNLLYAGRGEFNVLDWADSDVGDRHADVGNTLTMIRCMPAPLTHLHERLTLPLTRFLVARRYLSGYRRRLPLDRSRLRYFGAWAALRRLALYGRWLDSGPEVTGAKPSMLGHLRPNHLADVAAHFGRLTGVKAGLA